jgi:hypothetical protein
MPSRSGDFTGARPGSTTTCSPPSSTTTSRAAVSSTRPSSKASRVAPPAPAAPSTNSVPRIAPAAIGVSNSTSAGRSRLKKKRIPSSNPNRRFSDTRGGWISRVLRSPNRSTLRSENSTAARLPAPVRTRSPGRIPIPADAACHAESGPRRTSTVPATSRIRLDSSNAGAPTAGQAASPEAATTISSPIQIHDNPGFTAWKEANPAATTPFVPGTTTRRSRSRRAR